MEKGALTCSRPPFCHRKIGTFYKNRKKIRLDNSLVSYYNVKGMKPDYLKEETDHEK